MKTEYIIILAGLLILVLGICVMLFDIYGNLDFRIEGLEEVFILIGLTSTGLIIIGIGVVLNFTSRQYNARK